MKIATSNNSEADFRYKFVTDVEFYGVISDFGSETRIEVDREGDQEEIAFRTQGERLALWTKTRGESPVLKIYTPSEEIDLLKFKEKMEEFYSVFPEIPAYLKDAFSETPLEILESATNFGDQEVLAVIMSTEGYCKNI
jgi:hypothetical protein